MNCTFFLVTYWQSMRFNFTTFNDLSESVLNRRTKKHINHSKTSKLNEEKFVGKSLFYGVKFAF